MNRIGAFSRKFAAPKTSRLVAAKGTSGPCPQQHPQGSIGFPSEGRPIGRGFASARPARSGPSPGAGASFHSH